MLYFMEHYLGVWPDNGNGSFEYFLLVFVALLVIAIALCVQRYVRLDGIELAGVLSVCFVAGLIGSMWAVAW
jgi:hypothetical protein